VEGFGMPTTVVNGTELYYEEYGSGNPLILLHGLTANILMYTREIEYLKNHFHVVALDSRGHGKSEKPSSYTLNDHVKDVISLMDHLNINRASIMGISMGSYIAQGVALTIPDRVDKLILVSAKSNGKTSSMMRLFTEHTEELEGLDYMEKINHVSKYIFHNMEAVANELFKGTDESLILTTEQQTAANKALEGFDFRHELQKVTAQTLVVSGTYDGLNPPEEGKEIGSLIRDSQFVEFTESGHSPNVEEPEKFKQIVTEFLQK